MSKLNLYVWNIPNYNSGIVSVIASSIHEARRMVKAEDAKSDLCHETRYWKSRRHSILSEQPNIYPLNVKTVINILWGRGP